MKKISFLLFFLIILQSCGYSPLYSNNKNVDFYIELLSFESNDKDIGGFIRSNLKRYLVNNNEKKFEIKPTIKYEKKPVSKNLAGEIEEYNLLLKGIFEITIKDKTKNFIINETYKMNNFSDEFEERELERINKQNMARSVTSKLLIQLSRFNDN